MLQRRRSESGVVFYASPLLEQIGVPHGFSTRIGGVSPAPFDSLNLGNPNGCEIQDDHPRIEKNYHLFQAAIGCGDRARCWVHQLHGGAAAIVTRGRAFENGTQADALIGDDPDRVLAVRVADCVPILIASDDGHAVAAIHAGWRGIIADVIFNAIVRMSAARSIAAIGPCIGREAFEVGGDVMRAFAGKFAGPAPVRSTSDGKGHVDLRDAARLQLIDAGIAPDRIDTTDRCTHRDAGEFFSHRRDRGITGRMAAIIAPRRAGAHRV